MPSSFPLLPARDVTAENSNSERSNYRGAEQGFGPDWTGLQFDWREPVEARVGPIVIVVIPPCFDDVLGLHVA